MSLITKMKAELDRQQVPFAHIDGWDEGVVAIYCSPAVDLGALGRAASADLEGALRKLSGEVSDYLTGFAGPRAVNEAMREADALLTRLACEDAHRVRSWPRSAVREFREL